MEIKLYHEFGTTRILGIYGNHFIERLPQWKIRQLGKIMGSSQNQNLQRLMPAKAKIPTTPPERFRYDSESYNLTCEGASRVNPKLSSIQRTRKVFRREMNAQIT